MTESFKEFAKKVLHAFETENLEELKQTYIDLAEENDTNNAKRICTKLFSFCYDQIIKVVKSNTKNILLKYYAWHFLQLMTCCVDVKILLEKDFDVLPTLITINSQDWNDNDKEKSLKTISLHYIIFMLGEATDRYYDHFASTKACPYLYDILLECTVSQDDEYIELLLLTLSLLLEGSSNCKQQLVALDFGKLLIKKIHDRKECTEELLKVAHLTYQKLLLLTSDQQSFVETFRKGFTEEARKQPLYQEVKCFNVECNNRNITSYKRCSRCKLTTYCSRECQVLHWKSDHRKNCALTS